MDLRKVLAKWKMEIPLFDDKGVVKDLVNHIKTENDYEYQNQRYIFTKETPLFDDKGVVKDLVNHIKNENDYEYQDQRKIFTKVKDESSLGLDDQKYNTIVKAVVKPKPSCSPVQDEESLPDISSNYFQPEKTHEEEQKLESLKIKEELQTFAAYLNNVGSENWRDFKDLDLVTTIKVKNKSSLSLDDQKYNTIMKAVVKPKPSCSHVQDEEILPDISSNHFYPEKTHEKLKKYESLSTINPELIEIDESSCDDDRGGMLFEQADPLENNSNTPSTNVPPQNCNDSPVTGEHNMENQKHPNLESCWGNKMLINNRETPASQSRSNIPSVIFIPTENHSHVSWNYMSRTHSVTERIVNKPLTDNRQDSCWCGMPFCDLSTYRASTFLKDLAIKISNVKKHQYYRTKNVPVDKNNGTGVCKTSQHSFGTFVQDVNNKHAGEMDGRQYNSVTPVSVSNNTTLFEVLPAETPQTKQNSEEGQKTQLYIQNTLEIDELNVVNHNHKKESSNSLQNGTEQITKRKNENSQFIDLTVNPSVSNRDHDNLNQSENLVTCEMSFNTCTSKKTPTETYCEDQQDFSEHSKHSAVDTGIFEEVQNCEKASIRHAVHVGVNSAELASTEHRNSHNAQNIELQVIHEKQKKECRGKFKYTHPPMNIRFLKSYDYQRLIKLGLKYTQNIQKLKVKTDTKTKEITQQKQRFIKLGLKLNQNIQKLEVKTDTKAKEITQQNQVSQLRAYACERCGEIFKRYNSYNRQCVNCVKKTEQTDSSHKAGSSRKLDCEKCGKTFSFKSRLLRHLDTHSIIKRFICLVCCRAFQNEGSLRYHEQNAHSTETHKCSRCNKFYKSVSALKLHQNRKHRIVPQEKPVACDLCGKIYTSKKGLQNHSKVQHRVSDSKKFTCNDCSASYTSKMLLIYHITSQHMPPTFKCSKCSELLHTKRKLENHMRLQHLIDSRKVFVCEICGKTTRNSVSLEQHHLIHTDEMPFICEECGKCFRTVTNLKQHSTIHKSIRPFTCEICEKSFRIRHHLKQHMAVHGMVSTPNYGKRKGASSLKYRKRKLTRRIRKISTSSSDSNITCNEYSDSSQSDS